MLIIAPAFGQSISPLRGVIANQAQSLTFTISNPDDHTRDYAVTWLEMTALPNGTYESTAGDKIMAQNASSYLSVSPARFSLLPRSSQQVTVKFTSDQPFPMAERRSHLLVKSSPAPQLRKQVTGKLAVDMITGVSVPVLLRAKPPKAEITISNVHLSRSTDGGLNADISIERSGPDSLYGAIRVVGRAYAQAKPGILAQIDNIAIYKELGTRTISLPLGLANLPEGQFEVIFEGRGAHKGKIFARRIFNVGPPPKV